MLGCAKPTVHPTWPFPRSTDRPDCYGQRLEMLTLMPGTGLDRILRTCPLSPYLYKRPLDALQLPRIASDPQHQARKLRPHQNRTPTRSLLELQLLIVRNLRFGQAHRRTRRDAESRVIPPHRRRPTGLTFLQYRTPIC